MKLYELAEQYDAILLEVAAADGELSTDLETRLDAIGDALVMKLDACAAMVRTLEGEAQVYKTEAALHTEKRRIAEAAVGRLKAYMQSALATAQQRSVKGKRFTVAIQASTPRVELLVSDAELPPEFTRTRVEVDKTAIKKALEAGDPVAVMVAELVPGESLRIR